MKNNKYTINITIINYFLYISIVVLSLIFYINYTDTLNSVGLYFIIGNFWFFLLAVIANYLYSLESEKNVKSMNTTLKQRIFSGKNSLECFRKNFIYTDNYAVANFFKRLHIRKNITDKDNRDLRNNFAKLLPEKILKEMGKDIAEDIDVGMSVQKDLHIMFIDISGFTRISELMSPEKTLQLLNVYFNGIVDISKEHGGYVDKFLGDGIMLVFDQVESDNAVKTAIEVRKLVNKLNIAGLYENIDIGVGINSGIATLGTVGSRDRMDITIIGDCVNVASRLEGLSRELDDWIIIGTETYSRLGNKESFIITDIGEVSLRGRDGKINVYGVKDQ